jgi:hypothetical protein
LRNDRGKTSGGSTQLQENEIQFPTEIATRTKPEEQKPSVFGLKNPEVHWRLGNPAGSLA